MTIRLSSGLADAIISNTGLGMSMSGGYIQVYGGEQPFSADLPPEDPLLAIITTQGAPPLEGGALYMEFGPMPGTIVNADPWVLTGQASGEELRWWRFVGLHDDGQGASHTACRIDGEIQDCFTNFPTSIGVGVQITLSKFIIALHQA